MKVHGIYVSNYSYGQTKKAETHISIGTLSIRITGTDSLFTLINLLTILFGVLGIVQAHTGRSIATVPIRTSGALIPRKTVLALVSFIARIGLCAL